MTLDFTGRVAVVTGAGRGLGRRYALDLDARGARVVVVARRREAAEEVCGEIAAAGGTAVACVADARDGAAPAAVATEAFGRIDALVVNAGHVRDHSFAKLDDDAWHDVVETHLDGARRVTAAVWPTMLAQQHGRIVLTTSGAGLHGNHGQANYAAAKAGVLGLGRTLALEGRRRDVTVNMIAPMALTDMTADVFDQRQQTLRPDQVSPVVLALAHPSCRVTGAVLEAGGGWVGGLRWERSAGIRLADPTPEEVAARLDDVLRFDGHADHPASVRDSLEAATRRTDHPADTPEDPCPTTTT